MEVIQPIQVIPAMVLTPAIPTMALMEVIQPIPAIPHIQLIPVIRHVVSIALESRKLMIVILMKFGPVLEGVVAQLLAIIVFQYMPVQHIIIQVMMLIVIGLDDFATLVQVNVMEEQRMLIL